MPTPSRLRLAFALLSLHSVGVLEAATDVLPRWREHLSALNEQVVALNENLIASEAADTPAPTLPPAFRAACAQLLPRLVLGPDDVLVFDRIHGPESPFPDHQPLRQLASVRTVLARVALAEGDTTAALALVRQNLALARAMLRAQEGLIPLINAVSVWQSALDGVHALALAPALTAPEAHSLLVELQRDEGLAQIAPARALRGEFTYVYRVIVERMPVTDDPDLLLSSVSTLGMSPPEPLEPGEIGLGLTDHPLLDPAATLAAYEADLAPYLAAFAYSARYPRGLYETTTVVTLEAYRRELGHFFDYSVSETPLTLTDLALARADLLAANNPVGKLLALFLTPPWRVYASLAYRRDAQRSALCGLLAWRIHGGPTTWDILVAKGLLPSPPADPFSTGDLHYELGPRPRIWSVFVDGRDNDGVTVESNIGQPADLVWQYLR